MKMFKSTLIALSVMVGTSAVQSVSAEPTESSVPKYSIENFLKMISAAGQTTKDTILNNPVKSVAGATVLTALVAYAIYKYWGYRKKKIQENNEVEKASKKYIDYFNENYK